MSRKGRSKSHGDHMHDHLKEHAAVHGDGPVRLGQVAAWLPNERKRQPERRRVLKEPTRHLSAAARAKRRADAQGRRPRTMRAAKRPQGGRNGKLLFEALRDRIGATSAEHARGSFDQRG